MQAQLDPLFHPNPQVLPYPLAFRLYCELYFISFQILCDAIMAESLSQHSNLTGSNGPISMALAKLSYCTTSTYQKRLQWEHLHNRNGMFVVFDIIRRREARGGITEDRVIKLIVNSRLTVRIFVRHRDCYTKDSI